LTLIALGGLLALDDRAGWQGLLSQPLFVALFVGVVVGGVEHAIVVGLAMELVWLAILPMRGTRRPDAVSGAVVGAGTTCILIQQMGDPRFAFIAGMGAFAGLCVGEGAGFVVRGVGRVLARRLAGFSPPADGRLDAITRKLDAYQAFTLLYIFVLEALLVAVALPVSLIAVEGFTRFADKPFSSGASLWLDLLPALGAAAMIQHFWHRPANRFLAIAAVIVLVVLWMG
jgi:mannose/fructose/N-acetylgalactosamine-specific phosphotransferase system component IIC